MVRSTLLGAALLLGVCAPAKAQMFTTGSEFVGWCRRQSIACEGYLEGVVDMQQLDQALTNTQNQSLLRVCLPEHASLMQIKDVSLRYLDAHPEIWHANAASMIASALSKAFPCP